MTTPVPSDAPLGLQPPMHRLPDDVRCGPVRLVVADLARSIAWYESVLGFAVRRREAAQAVLGAAGDEGTLLELHERPGARPVPRSGHVGLFHVAYLLPDRPALARFVRHVADLGVRAASSDHHVSEAVYLTDPDGLGVEVYRDRPRTHWRRAGRELHMTTEPLDVASLLADAGDTPWTGAPAGTVVGHVHLSVSDLERVRAFHYAALGLDIMVWRYPGALFLAGGGYHHHLGTNIWRAEAPRPGPDDARLHDWSLVVPTDDARERTIASVASYGHPVQRDVDGSVRFVDPFGIGVRILVG
jgi:catechol 2,3-dioxygenase